MTTTGTPESAAAASFPPTDLGAFLQLCAGDWMSLRSRFLLGSDQDGRATPAVGSPETGAGEPPLEADDNSWHASERADLTVGLLAANGNGHGNSHAVGHGLKLLRSHTVGLGKRVWYLERLPLPHEITWRNAVANWKRGP